MKNVVFWDMKHRSYLIGNAFRLRYEAQPINATLRFEVFEAVTARMPPSGMLRRVALVRTDV
jgi:hypothetical protein